jgi:hypothetical protein
MPRYGYNKLDETANEIRLVTLFPGVDKSDIVADLHTISFNPDEPVPNFEALSYTWGSSENSPEISIGHLRDCSLKVTRNLEVALRHLRYADKPRIMWIDAICVNQDDLDERGEQVKRMADIYARAKQVTVWIGPAGPNTDTAIRALNSLSSKIQANWSFWRTTPAQDSDLDDNHWSDPESPLPYSSDTVAGIQDLYGREWFQRLWIQQEIRMANVEAIVVCGQAVILWSDLRKSALCLFNKSSLNPTIDKAGLRHVWSMGDLGYTNLSGIISFTRRCRCSDPRDRIFAVLSFLETYERDLKITPDYNMTTKQVFQEAIWQWIQHNSALDILTLCDGTSTTAGLPSWVPNLAIPPSSCLLQTISTASARASCAALRDGDNLSLQGIHVATINEVDKWQEDESITNAIRRLATPLLEEITNGKRHELVLDAFCMTLNGGLFSNIYIPEDKNSPNWDTFRDIVKKILEGGDGFAGISASQLKELDNANKYLRGRSLLRTDSGGMGLGPDTTKPGDEIVILLGGRGAFVVRPSRDGHFQMVGECYLHGFMNGEALLGPLPPQTRSIARYDEKTGAYWRCYLNENSGHYAIEDPRLGPLPSGWRRKDHDRDHVISWFVNDTTGEGLDMEWRDNGFPDPRASAEAFINKGIGLRYFHLV